MSDSAVAIKYVLVNEGGFVNNPEDHGGPTNFGLSQRFLSGWTLGRIKNMTQEEAIEVYQIHIWKPIFAEIKDQDVCNYYFDMVVNHGYEEATKMLQRSLWAIHPETSKSGNISGLPDDGGFGPKTLNEVNITQSGSDDEELIIAMRATRAQFFRGLASKPGQAQFLSGWLARAYRS